jgi:hypothetical protein
MGYSSALACGRVYGISDKGKVFCQHRNSGDFIWQADTGSVIYDSEFLLRRDKGWQRLHRLRAIQRHVIRRDLAPDDGKYFAGNTAPGWRAFSSAAAGG